MKHSDPCDFAHLLQESTRPTAFPFALPDTYAIPVIQTHASAVLLTPELVYKLKKPRNFGFFDYSTSTLRRHFCQQEVAVNQLLAPGIYLGVAPVLLSRDGHVHFGATYEADEVPAPGTTLADGSVVDYAVVMKRLPDEATLAERVRSGTATPALMAEIGRFLASFHAATATDERIARFGELAAIRTNWEENFVQMKPYCDRTLDTATYDRIVAYACRFMAGRATLFEQRIHNGRIRDCHGDLRLQHIYLLDEQTAINYQGPRLVILDRIEFNERFRYGDVASEVAFLTMELEAAGRPDLASTFVQTYVEASGDETLRDLLPFYSCYRACVRGKVSSFQLDEPEVPAEQRQEAQQAAIHLFTLAARYAHYPAQPLLILVGGLMGTGKSTIALALQRELGWAYISSDIERKRLAHIDPTQSQTSAFGQGLYSTEWTTRTYDALRQRAASILAEGRSVLVDATFMRRADRLAMAREAARHDATMFFVECRCPRERALERLAQRQRWQTVPPYATREQASRASDARPDLFDDQRNRWEPFMPDEERDSQHIIVDTTSDLTDCIAVVLDALDIPRWS